jgi:hypothetical protein
MVRITIGYMARAGVGLRRGCIGRATSKPPVEAGTIIAKRGAKIVKDNTRKIPPTKPISERKFIDQEGVQRVVLVPEGSENLAAGIPVSLDISQLFEHMPKQFVVEFTAALHAQGLIKPADYFQVGASDKYKAALLMVIRNDFLSAQALAQQVLDKRS